MRKKSDFQEVWTKGRADGAGAELGIPVCVRARGELAAGAQGCWGCSGILNATRVTQETWASGLLQKRR